MNLLRENILLCNPEPKENEMLQQQIAIIMWLYMVTYGLKTAIHNCSFFGQNKIKKFCFTVMEYSSFMCGITHIHLVYYKSLFRTDSLACILACVPTPPPSHFPFNKSKKEPQESQTLLLSEVQINPRIQVQLKKI